MSLQKKLAGVVVGGLSIAVGVYYFYNKSLKSKKPSSKPLNRSVIVDILKQMKKEMFVVFQNFSTISQNISQQSMGRAKPEQIQQMILSQPMFSEEIRGIEEAVYEKYCVSRQAFENACQNYYQNDEEIKCLQAQMKVQFERSFQGVSPDPKTSIPSFLTPKLTIGILKKIMSESARRLNTKFSELLESGEMLSFNNPKLAEIMSKMKMDNGKNEILEEYGLNGFEDSGSQILQYATQVYSEQNEQGFCDSIKEVETKFSALMERIMMSGPMKKEEFEAYVSDGFKIDSQ